MKGLKIVKLKGGLGNQMFQYAYALLMRKRTNEDVLIDYSAYNGLKNDEVRVPRIAKFNISLKAATNDEIDTICILKHRGNSQSFKYRLGILIEKTLNAKYFWEPDRGYIDPSKIEKYKYIDGYWQSWRYIEEVRDEIKKEFVPNYELSEKTLVTKAQMEEENSVFVGVRRGDYAEEVEHYGSFDSEYYRKAMSYIASRVENPVFYIFSNDVAWCKENIDWSGFDVRFREEEMQTSDFEELMLMSTCKHAIIVNSSYHWWGASLNDYEGKIVCCPVKWWFDDKPIDIIYDKWVRIS